MFSKGNRFGRGGRRPGAGRPADKIRAICGTMLKQRLPILAKIADDPEERTSDRIAALREMIRITLPAQAEHTGPDGGPLHIIAMPADE